MKHYSPESVVKHVDSIPVASFGAGTTDGTSIDTAGFGDVIATLLAGTNQATGTNDTKLQDSADNVTFADIPGAAFTQVTTGNDNANYRMLLREGSHKRYVRPRQVIATAACVAGVVLEAFAPSRSEDADGEAAFQTIVAPPTVSAA